GFPCAAELGPSPFEAPPAQEAGVAPQGDGEMEVLADSINRHSLLVAIHRLRIERLLAVERQRHRAVLAERHHPIEARAPAGVAGAGAVLLDLDPDRVLVAVDAHLDDALGVAGLLALAPELAARAAEVPGITRCNGARERFRIHMRDHKELARL